MPLDLTDPGMTLACIEPDCDALCTRVIAENPDLVERYREGKLAIAPLVGKVMTLARGAAKPQLVVETLRKLLAPKES